jgi:hypothetical protein
MNLGHSVADPDPGTRIRCLFDPWIWDMYFPDPGSPTHISESFVTIFGEKVL